MKEMIQFRVGIDDFSTIQASAKKKGLTVSEYCRRTILLNSNVVIVEVLTDILNTIYRMVDANVNGDDINRLTSVVTAGVEQVLDKLDSLNIQGGGSCGNMGYKEPSE